MVLNKGVSLAFYGYREHGGERVERGA